MTDSIVTRRCFIYSIESSTGKQYIGASLKPKYRLTSHITTAKQGVHRSRAFQVEFDATGGVGFSMKILADVPENLRQAYEDIYINLYKPELNGVQASVPFKDKAHIDKVNAARKNKPTFWQDVANANEASAVVIRRKVLCVENGKVFDSVREAGNFAGGHRLGVALKHPNRTAYGYHWRYADDNYRPRKGNFVGRSKTKIQVVETGEIFHNHSSLKEWYASKGIKISSPSISSGCTQGNMVGGFYLKRIDI